MKTVLDLHRRPTVLFDPSNKDHRKYVAEFLATGTWGRCPVVFFAPDEANTKAFAIESLADYYLTKEFKVEIPSMVGQGPKVRFKRDGTNE